MKRSSSYLLAVLFILLLCPFAIGSNLFPLEPPDTSSPRGTLESFLYYSGKFSEAMRADEEDPIYLRETLERAERCFDLSGVPPTLMNDVAIESVLRMREILDRIDLPDMTDAPDKLEIKHAENQTWRIPHTEITIGKVLAGPRLGAYLFTPDTVDRLDEFYEEIRHLPYKDGSTQSIYEEYIYSSGWMIPDGFIRTLPEFLRTGYMGQALWQWTSLVLLIAAGLTIIILSLIYYQKMKRNESFRRVSFVRLLFPLCCMGLSVFLEYLIRTQINITGRVLTVVTLGLETTFFLFAGWAILTAGNLVMHGIILSQHIKEEALDADVIKLVCRLISLTLVFALFYRAGGYFGLPVTAVFASAGIAGVAVALAARETLANFFGGVSIFLDRPFRAGDYIVLDSGERGEVKAVGMRSTRMQTRDDILITIPNSVITNVKITNQSAPYSHSRVHINVGVAYDSDLERVESLLLEVANKNVLAMPNPAPRVRVRTFGESSVNLSLLVWVARPHDRGRLTHELNKEILKTFNLNGIVIPFNQHDVYIKSFSEKNSDSK